MPEASAAPTVTRMASTALSAVRRHPDAMAVASIVACAVLPRAVLLFGAPVFIMKDSASYFLPAWDLAHGLPFDLELRRTPLYPWFAALVLRLFGDSVTPLAAVQHVLGIVTAVATFWMGRLAFGRGVGLAAGLLTALAGPLLIFEHYVMPEALFTCLLVSGVALLLAGCRSGQAGWFAVGGVVLGLAALTRPAAQLVLLGLPPIMLLSGASFAAVARRSAVALAGAAVVLLPWMAAVYSEHGVVSTGATVGEPLIFRVVHQDRGFRLPDPAATPYPDAVRNDARRIVIGLAARRANPSEMVERLRRDLRMSRPAADAALRDVAVETIAAQPGYYALSTARLTALLFLGRHEALNLAWTTRRDRAGEDTLENWQEAPRIEHLIRPATADQRAAYPWVDLAVNLVQPSRVAVPIGLLLAIGTVAAAAHRPWRPGLLLLPTIAALILTCTLFSGAVYRFRYPADPFILTLAAAGALACWQALSRRARRSTRPARRPPALRPAVRA